MDEIQARARMAAPRELCGLLFGVDDAVEHYLITRNVADQPETGFEIDPAALIAAEREMRDGGRQILGYFHSHPRGPTQPSRTDAALAAPDGRTWLIVDGERAEAWRARKAGAIHNRFEPMALDCSAPHRQRRDHP